MTPKQLADKLASARGNRKYSGELTSYVVSTIENGKSIKYPVVNLITYCEGCDLQFAITDMNTDESYDVDSVLDIHKILNYLMRMYGIKVNDIFQRIGVHYTPPKSLDENVLGDMEGYTTSLSITTLLLMCSMLHCRLDFVRKNS